MKKLIALLLTAVMCMSLAACGGNGASAEKAMIGAWNMGEYDVFVFSEDGKVARGDEEYDWWYDKETERYFLSIDGITLSFVIEEDENGRFFDVDGERLYYFENYDPAALEAEYIVSLTEGKTELVVGNTYTTESGVEFTFEKAEIAGEDTDCKFNLYLTYEGYLDIEQGDYESFSGWHGFGWGRPADEEEGNTHRYIGPSMEMSRLEKDREKYGILSFTIEGTAYYVSINTFFE